MASSTFKTSDGCNIFYTVHEAKGAPKLALIHSLALDGSVWDGVVERLKGKAELLVPDCRGHGRSGRPHMAYSSELFARDIKEVLDSIGWNKTAAAGCSMGGCVAQALGGLYPERMTGLALIDTTAWYGPDAPKQFRERAAAAKAKGMQGLIDFQISRWFSTGFPAANPARVEETTKVFLANDFDCYEST